MLESAGKAVPIVCTVTKWLVGGSPAAAEVDRFFILNDPPVCTYNPEASTYFQGTAFIHFKESFNMFHDHRGLVKKTNFTVHAITVGHAS